MQNKRKTLDDLLNEGRPSDNFYVGKSKKGRPKVIRKKKILNLKKEEIYLSETDLKKEAKKFLIKLPRCKLLSTDNMPLIVGNGRRVKTRNPGMSDQHLCIRGLFVALEAKQHGKDLDPDQVDYKNDVEAAGGIHITYHSVKELISEMKRYKLVSLSM
jgi:hypothetical protein